MVLLKNAALGLLLSSLAVGLPVKEASTLVARQAGCAPIHLLVARGSTEAPGDGQLGSLAADIISAHPGATQESINYPALLSPYPYSVGAGTVAVKNQLTAYVQQCPSSQIVLLGYSQGAQIIGDALCGGDSAGTTAPTPPLSANFSSHVNAIIWYGDPRHVVGKPFDRGTSNSNGIYARPQTESCDSFSNKIASYCDFGDPFCASGNEVSVHLTYPSRYDNSATQFVNSKLT